MINNQYPYFGTGVQQPNTFYNQPPQQIGIRGKFISDLSEIQISDVPNDGTVGVFPSRDGNYIITKSWNSDGTVNTKRFSLENLDIPTEQDTRFEKIEKRISELEKRMNRKGQASNAA